MTEQLSRLRGTGLQVPTKSESPKKPLNSPLDLANPQLQHISTRNSLSNFEYIKQLLGEESALKLFDGILQNPDSQLYRCYQGKPLDLNFFCSPDYWYCNEINLRIFANAAALGVDLEQMGYHTVQMSLQQRQQTILGLIHLLGVEKIFKQAQKVNALYNRTKSVEIYSVSKTGVMGQLQYHPGLQHSLHVTTYNIGCYRGVLEYLGYQEVKVELLEEHFATDTQPGSTMLGFSWKPMSLKQRLAMLLGNLMCPRLFTQYLSSSQCLRRYHQPVVDAHQYYQQRTQNLITELEQQYGQRLSLKQLEIERLNDVVTEQQAVLTRLQDPFALRAEKWLEQNGCKMGVSATDFAADFCMSERTLNRKLGDSLGAPAKTLINRYKLNKSRHLLEQGVPIIHTAEACGFSSPSYFTQAFKKQFGYTPSECKAS
ncbi:helix-turn-helix domain-containing protein [Shewanella avicenniae]|uniref:Helix-turn-helix domain-containing protein n=1 Tax=Shewanella avicenniae TaxID=2814294 RepID=A0ABX7QRQ2_9GAMM|nr:helix-turn-helix domain-containing protein [Shewanella avicenniae]QSX33395.1 helix-turn-helix domain-containing protein [Shewanella avicenniae]